MFVCGIVLHLLLDLVYRPWAWSIGAHDLHFADSFTNVTAVVIASAVMVAVEGTRLFHDKASTWLIVIAPVTGMIAYEFVQIILPFGRFDAWDIGWTFIGGAIARVVQRSVYRTPHIVEEH